MCARLARQRQPNLSRGRGRTFFFFTLFTGPSRSLSLKLSDTSVYEPQIRARLGTTAQGQNADERYGLAGREKPAIAIGVHDGRDDNRWTQNVDAAKIYNVYDHLGLKIV